MKFELNGIEWKIEEQRGLHDIEGRPCFGRCDEEECTIYIDRDINTQLKRKALIHELTHAVMYCYLLDSPETFTREDIAMFMANYLTIEYPIVDRYFKH